MVDKYVGSLSPQQAHNSMFTEEFQRFEQLLPDEKSLVLLSNLMGTDSSLKHDFLFDRLDFSIIRE